MDRQDRWRERYAAIRPGWTPTPHLYAALIADRVDAGTRVLDIGCGHADLLADVLAPAARVVGIDLDREALRRNPTIRQAVVASAERLPFDDASFDLVLLAWVVEHLERPASAFREMHRVLDRGGRVLFVTPNAWNYNAWLIRLVPNALHPFFTRRLYGRAAADTFPTRYRFNSPRRIDRVLSRIGFAKERIVLNGDPTYVAVTPWLFRLATWMERLYDLPWLRRARVHIVAVFRKG